jgi:hypothetical protein
VRQIQPGGALVVEVGQRALFEVGFAHAGRVEPGVTPGDEFPGGLGDGLDAGVVLGFVAGGPGEGFDGGCVCRGRPCRGLCSP